MYTCLQLSKFRASAEWTRATTLLHVLSVGAHKDQRNEDITVSKSLTASISQTSRQSSYEVDAGCRCCCRSSSSCDGVWSVARVSPSCLIVINVIRIASYLHTQNCRARLRLNLCSYLRLFVFKHDATDYTPVFSILATSC